jgi:hypothetical protein
MGLRDYSTAKGRIVDANGFGDFTTIQAAITAASAGQTIFIRPATYTENLTLKAGVDLVAFFPDGFNGNVTIVGKCTFTGSGSVSCSGIRFQTNSDFCISVTGSSASVINIFNSYINATNNTALELTSSNAGSAIIIQNTVGNLGTTGIGMFAASGAGSITFGSVGWGNSGGSTTQSTISSGVLNVSGCGINCPITMSGTALGTLNESAFDTSSQSVTPFTLNIAGAINVDYCKFIGGTATALVVTAGLAACRNSIINSSNAAVVSGAGGFNYYNIAFTNSGTDFSVTTPFPLNGTNASLIPIGAASVTAAAQVDFTNLTNKGSFRNYLLIWSNVVAASGGGQALRLLYNQGAGFVTTGYSGNGLFGNSAGGPATITTVTTYAILGSTLGSSPPACSGSCLIGNAIFANSQGGTYMTSAANDRGSVGVGLWGGTLGNTAALTQLRIAMASGNIATGTFALYGVLS